MYVYVHAFCYVQEDQDDYETQQKASEGRFRSAVDHEDDEREAEGTHRTTSPFTLAVHSSLASSHG